MDRIRALNVGAAKSQPPGLFQMKSTMFPRLASRTRSTGTIPGNGDDHDLGIGIRY